MDSVLLVPAVLLLALWGVVRAVLGKPEYKVLKRKKKGGKRRVRSYRLRTA